MPRLALLSPPSVLLFNLLACDVASDEPGTARIGADTHDDPAAVEALGFELDPDYDASGESTDSGDEILVSGGEAGAEQSTGDAPSGPFCGDAVRDEGERCDGTDMPSVECADAGLGPGSVSCSPDCLTYDYSGCAPAPEQGEPEPSCGNDLIEGSEMCDGADLGGRTCLLLGYGDGVLGCKPDCAAFHTSDCAAPTELEPATGPICGNDVNEGTEVCDGADLRGASCVSLGYAGGELDCALDCSAYDLVDCG